MLKIQSDFINNFSWKKLRSNANFRKIEMFIIYVDCWYIITKLLHFLYMYNFFSVLQNSNSFTYRIVYNFWSLQWNIIIFDLNFFHAFTQRQWSDKKNKKTIEKKWVLIFPAYNVILTILYYYYLYYQW